MLLTCRLRTLSEIFIGDTTIQAAMAAGRVDLKGPTKLTRNVRQWLRLSPLASVIAAKQRSELHVR